jgi:Tol biopolymer transport system component
LRRILLLTVPMLMAADAIRFASVEGANIQAPAWAPNGKNLSFEANFHDEKRIELHVGPNKPDAFQVVRMPSRGESKLAGFDTSNASAGRVMHELAWAPQGGGVFAYAASTSAQDYDLFISEGAPLAPAPGADGGATWSPNGRWLLFTSARTGQGDLYLLDVQAIEQPPRRLTKDPTHAELFAAWAPDSESIVYVGHADQGDTLWTLSLRDGVPQQLTTWAGQQLRPSFAPDGSAVAFYANHEQAGRFDLYVLPVAAGSVPRKLADGVVANVHGPLWSPDAKHLLYVADDDKAYDPVMAVGSHGGAPKVLQLGTVGHGDMDLAIVDGVPTLAVVAQGLTTDADRTFKRLFVAPLPAL